MRLLAVAALCLLTACASSAPPADGPPGSIALTGVTITPPADTAWTLIAADERRAAFGWTGGGSTAELHAELVADDSTADAAAFLTAAEARYDEALRADGREMVSVHFNGAALAGATCMQYDGIYHTPAAAPARDYRRVFGYLCRHPHTAGRAVWLHLVHDGAERETPELEAMMNAADAFFRAAVFTDAGGAGGPA